MELHADPFDDAGKTEFVTKKCLDKKTALNQAA